MMNWVSNDSSTPDESPQLMAPIGMTEGSGSELTTEALRSDQNKFIHLDPIPDFKDRSEIKPWLQKIFYPQGIEIVIERSDSIKVVFKCKAAKRGKNTRASEPVAEQFSVPSEPVESKTKDRKKKKRSVSRFNICPFRIRATYSLKRKKWSIVVLNNCHSHPLKFNPDSEEYRKFKEKLRQNNDWEAIKKFDELEYRTRSNLPIESSPIRCDCGLTEEIASFNIVLPSTNHSSVSSTLVKKPKKKSGLRKQRKEAFLMMPTQQHHLANTTHVQSPSVSGFLDDPSANPLFTTPITATDAFTDLNEIDFTNMFDKMHHNSTHSRAQQRHSGAEDALNVFSPLAISSFQYCSPSGDLVQSPAHPQAPPASTTHGGMDNAVDFSMKPFLDLPGHDSFTPPLCEINGSNACQDHRCCYSELNAESSPARDMLSGELDVLKAINGELSEHLTTELFNLQ
ncbi:hypothetical protein HG536_0E05290 [Torulaspora globosa]|uniref:Uncharacterized protein n=1 Tax=Torulaspora globosa TaxID=48254 RepID=A0A7G3ZJD2_9SACH|nr:uncharacterized protein HG536_0E05290 [Torulaspora globosa]QLL33618.1 hypothetical protein HG536_0E05290 [Torulaspora globosa]